MTTFTYSASIEKPMLSPKRLSPLSEFDSRVPAPAVTPNTLFSLKQLRADLREVVYENLLVTDEAIKTRTDSWARSSRYGKINLNSWSVGCGPTEQKDSILKSYSLP